MKRNHTCPICDAEHKAKLQTHIQIGESDMFIRVTQKENESQTAFYKRVDQIKLLFTPETDLI
jgi:hypothetical protein